MEVYAQLDGAANLAEIPDFVRRVEALGYDGVHIPETQHDGFLASLMALQHSERLTVTTAVIIAFPRSPMVTAQAAWDLQRFAGGRFELGIGTQVKGNIVQRFSAPWGQPVRRMRNYIGSLRAIWDCWQNSVPLDYHSEDYTFTRMQPFFNPGPNEHNVRIILGGINPSIVRLAGELCDGIITHPTNSDPLYIKESILPGIEVGASLSGRAKDDVFLGVASLLVTGATREELAANREATRSQMGFLYSTQAFWPTLELHGWGEVGRRLHQIARQGRWKDLAGEITDGMMDRLTVSGVYDEIAGRIKERVGGLADRVLFPLPRNPSHDGMVARVVEALKT